MAQSLIPMPNLDAALKAALAPATLQTELGTSSSSSLAKQLLAKELDLLRGDDLDPYRNLYGFSKLKVDGRYLLNAPGEFDLESLPPEDRSGVIDLLKGAVGTGLSVLGTIGSVLYRPVAATLGLVSAVGGALRGDTEGAREAYSNLFYLVPLPRTWTNSILKKLNIPFQVPEEMLSGRRALEITLGATKNKPGWRPLGDPWDAFLDTVGLGLELFAPLPYLPRVGVLTKAGEKAFRLGEEAKVLSKAHEALRGIGSRLLEQPKALEALGRGESYGAKMLSLAKTLGYGDEELRYLRDLVKDLPEEVTTKLHGRLQTALKTGNAETVAQELQNLPDLLTAYGTLGGKKIVPAVSWEGRIQEAQQGLRGIVLEPGKGWDQILPRIEFGGPAVAKTLDVLSSLPLIRAARALFDWTTKSVLGKAPQAGAGVAMETLQNNVAAFRSLMLRAQEFDTVLGDDLAKWIQQAQLADNQVALRSFSDMMMYLLEHQRKFKGTLEEKAAQFARFVFGGQTPPDDFIKTAKEMFTLAETHLTQPTDIVFQIRKRLGAPIESTKNIFAPEGSYMPRYSWGQQPPRSALTAPSERMIASESAQFNLSRKVALQHVPGGTAMIDQASRDIVLVNPAPAKKPQYKGLLSGVNAKNQYFHVGEYVRGPNDHLGRIIGFENAKTARVMFKGMEQPVSISLDELRYSPAPVQLDAYIPAPRLTQYQQAQIAKEWLMHHGIKLQQAAIKGKEGRLRILQQYATERYHKPFLPDDPELARLWYNEGIPVPAKAIMAKFREAKTSKRFAVWASEQVKKRGGLSAPYVEYLQQLSHDRGLFSHDILNNYKMYWGHSLDEIAALSSVHEMFRRAAMVAEKPAPNLLGFSLKPTEQGVSLRQAWQSITLPKTRGFRAGPLTEEGLETLLNTIKETNPELYEKARLAASLQRGKTVADMIQLPTSVVEQAKRFLQVMWPGTPERNWWDDGAKRFFRWASAWLTQPRLAFHGRNWFSDMSRVAMADGPLPPLEVLKIHSEVSSRGFKGEWSQLPFFDEIKRFGVLSGGVRAGDLLTEATDIGLGVFGRQAAAIPGGLQAALPELAALRTKEGWKKILTSESPILEAGRRVFETVEGIGRATAYIAARKGGMEPGQALEWMKRVMYDYSRLSPFEQRIVRPTVFFYGWLRQNLGYMIPKVLLDWSSRPSRVYRGIYRVQQAAGEELPVWLQDNLGIPLPWEVGGKQVVIRSLGLPLEDLKELNPDMTDMMGRIFSRLHPAFKSLYMLSTGTDPFTGLPLKESKSNLQQFYEVLAPGEPGGKKTVWPRALQTGTQVVEPLLPPVSMLGYLSRIFRREPLAPQIKDPWLRTGMDVVLRTIDATTGIKFGAYDLEKLALNEMRERLMEQLRQRPEVRVYERPYVRSDVIPSETTAQLQELYNALEKYWQQQAKEAKQRGPLQLD